MIPNALGHYRILHAAGSGGMGEVYVAEDTKLGRKVALKVLPQETASEPERRARFEREARAIAALNHPNIVTIHSVEDHDGIVFLTMELVEGRTLSELTPRQGMALEALLKIAIPLADAVGAAHQRGITHRDLKPANVMVAHDGRVKVLDFGLAKLQEDAVLEGNTMTFATAPATADGRIMGTVAYMSPEQAEGKSVDPRSDIFSLGIVLFEMATGERPFRGDTNVSLLSAILKDVPLSVTDLRHDLPREFARILKRCLAKDPEERYQTAKDLRNDLRSLKEEIDSGEVLREQTRSGIGHPVVSAPAASARRRFSGAVIAGSALIAVLAVGGLWYAWRPGTEAPAPFSSIRMSRLTNTGDASLAAISPDGRYVVHVVGDVDRPSLWMRQVSTTSNVQIVAPMEGRFDGITFAPDGESVLYVFYPRGQLIASLFRVPLLGGVPRKLVDDIDTAPAFSPDGTRMAFIRGIEQGQEILVAGADGTGERRLALRSGSEVYLQGALSWSPDGRLIAASVGRAGPAAQARIVLVDAATGADRPLGDRTFDSIGQLTWLTGGGGIVFDAAEQGQGPGAAGQIWVVSHPDGMVRRLTNDLNNYSGVAAARSAHQLVAVQREQRAGLWLAPSGDAARAQPIVTSSGGREGVGGIAWTPDGRVVYSAATAGNWDLWIADQDGQNARQLTSDPGTEGLPRVSADGTRVLYTSDRSGQYEAWIMDLDGGNARQLTTGGAFLPDFLPDGSGILILRVVRDNFASFRVGFDGGEPTPLPATMEPLERFHGVRVSPDGRLVAGHYLDRGARGMRTVIVPMDGRGPVRRLGFTTDEIEWAPDGQALYDMQVREGAGNIWRFPLDGSAPRPVTNFTSDRIFRFAWSPGGKLLAMSRGTESADVVLISGDK